MTTWTTRLAAWLLAATMAGQAAAANAATWRAVDGAGTIGFVASQAGQPFEGRFENFQSIIAFDPDDLAASRAEITVDMASAVTGDPQKDSALPLPEWFDVKTHPEARFVVRSFRHVAEHRYQAAADLTIRGVTREVVMPFDFTISDDGAKVDGVVDLDRTDFGVGQAPWTSDQMVGHRVTVRISLKAEPSRQ